MFFTLWQTCVAKEHIPESQLELVGGATGGIASRLIDNDAMNWFQKSDRESAVFDTFKSAIDLLSTRLGNDMQAWEWGKLHVLTKSHVLGHIGDLGELLNHTPISVKGDMVTVGNTGQGPDWTSISGAGYRLIHDMGTNPPCMWAVDGQGQSGHPGSPHYNDQENDWLNAGYHQIVLTDHPDPTSDHFVITPS